jgi:hypothetical protein
VVPLFGRLAAVGLSLVAFLVAAPIGLVTIAVGWLFYRPVLAVALLAGAVAIGVALVVRMRRRAPVLAMPAFVPPPPPPAPAS